jgi:hypothetical protein
MAFAIWGKSVRRAAVLVTLSLMLVPGAVFAQASRTWVSGVGDDANPCSRTAPCKTFAGAISKTAAGGEISVLDPGGYGAVTITKSITINNYGGEAGVLVSGTNGVIINAASTDRVTLRGLTFIGLGTGIDGVRVLAAGEVVIENCLIDGFRGANPSHGILFTPNSGTSRLVVRNTTISANGQVAAGNGGISIKPTGSAYAIADLSGVNIVNNGVGLIVDSTGTSGASFVTLRDSQLTGSHLDGAFALSSPAGEVNMVLEGNTIAGNAFSGTSAAVHSDGSVAAVRLLNNVISSNNVGVQFTNGGTIFSYGGNIISGNSTNGSFTSTQPTQ